MVRRCFYSFHHVPDAWRASQVRNMGVVSGNKPATDNDWETVKQGGDAQIKKWINKQMDGRSCAVILAGSNTANRKWINYEIETAWNNGMGVVCVRVHGLKNASQQTSSKGNNPLYYLSMGEKRFSTIAKDYDPPRQTSQGVYTYIENNLADWVEEAISIRNSYN